MTAMYVKTTNGRHFVNEDFVEKVGELYPVTWEKIPLGWHVYTGWQGKDEVLFTQHAPIEDKEMEGQVYEVNWPPVRPEAFFEDILPFIQHTKLAHEETPMTRQRITWDQDELRKKWGMTLDETIEARKKNAARVPSGLYGYTKSVQGMCEVANRRIAKHAAIVIKKAAQKDPRVVDFLGAHAKRAKSLPARILLASYKDSIPKLASKTAGSGAVNAKYLGSLPPGKKAKILKHVAKHYGVSVPVIERELTDRDAENLFEYTATDRGMTMEIYRDFKRQRLVASQTAPQEKTAKHYGAYGFPARTANLGFSLCSQMREHAGVVAADLHRRKAAMHAKITGFLGAHGKQGKSGTSKLLLSVYPDESMSFGKRASTETHPQSVDDWLAWEPDAS
jgi:hypothetical protein